MAGSPQHVTLTANTPATLNFDVDFALIEVLNVDGAAAVYFTLDGSTPTVAGIGAMVLPAAICSVELEPRTVGAVHTGKTVVKLISGGTPKVSVRGL